MKQLMLAAVGLGSVIAIGFFVSRPQAPAVPPAETATESATPSASARALARLETGREVAAAPERPGPVDAPAPAAVLPAPAATQGVKLVFDQALETLVSAQTGYEQRQEIWQQLKRAGKLDQAISELEQRVAGNPQSVESVTSLGEGYYKKAGQTEDVREKAIYAMKADQTLEAALNLDPSSWEARFTKAAGMSRWPAELNKGQEVIEQFQALIQQQETQPSQPQFARSYLKLGEQYQKAGYPEYAAQVWQRGAALFPNDADLKGKLAPAQ